MEEKIKSIIRNSLDSISKEVGESIIEIKSYKEKNSIKDDDEINDVKIKKKLDDLNVNIVIMDNFARIYENILYIDKYDNITQKIMKMKMIIINEIDSVYNQINFINCHITLFKNENSMKNHHNINDENLTNMLNNLRTKIKMNTYFLAIYYKIFNNPRTDKLQIYSDLTIQYI